MINGLKEAFRNKFGVTEDGVFFSPGRINLIGEHTDYNGGNVFPCSISMGTYGVAKKREDKTVRLFSENLPELDVIEFSLDNLTYAKEDNWANYPKGMIKYIKEAGYAVENGFDLYIYGNIPNGAGLSSSASIELLTGVVVRDLNQLDVDMLELVKLGKKVENEFIGVNSGIMDQFAIGMGQKDHAILLDTNTLEYEMVPVKLGEYVIAIMNTNKRRELADSKYNERFAECKLALAHLQEKLDITALGELDNETFEANTDLIGDEILIKRARHAVSENQRTLAAKKALENNELVEFGKLLNEAHESVAKDYEVTGIELDTLVYTAQKQPGVLGARMTGAGFGGCSIALVKESELDNFIENVGREYEEKIGYKADFYEARIHDGAGRLE